jgi:hypothetical protein
LKQVRLANCSRNADSIKPTVGGQFTPDAGRRITDDFERPDRHDFVAQIFDEHSDAPMPRPA